MRRYFIFPSYEKNRKVKEEMKELLKKRRNL